MNNIPFNSECQTNGCDGSFIPVENYEHKEYEPTGENPWSVKYKCSHIITAYQCVKCGRIHGQTTLSTGNVIEFFEGNYSPVDFQTPSQFGKSGNVNKWNPEGVRSAVPTI